MQRCFHCTYFLLCFLAFLSRLLLEEEELELLERLLELEELLEEEEEDGELLLSRRRFFDVDFLTSDRSVLIPRR